MEGEGEVAVFGGFWRRGGGVMGRGEERRGEERGGEGYVYDLRRAV